MDFQSLGAGSPFYILRKGDKPVLEQGVVKEKTAPQPKYQQQTPGVYNGMGMQHVTSITVTVNGNDRVIPDVPVNVEIAARGNETFTGSRENTSTSARNKDKARFFMTLPLRMRI